MAAAAGVTCARMRMASATQAAAAAAKHLIASTSGAVSAVMSIWSRRGCMSVFVELGSNREIERTMTAVQVPGLPTFTVAIVVFFIGGRAQSGHQASPVLEHSRGGDGRDARRGGDD
jgi:hypothetical protein